MRKLGSILSGMFLILVFVASISFAYFNSTPISIALGNWVLPAQPVSVWIIAAFVVGGVLGLLLGLGFIRMRRSQSQIQQLKKELSKEKQEVERLRALSMKDLM
jgi:lipopolysaccharide assembly protein A